MSAIHPLMVRLEQRLDAMIEDVRNGLESRLQPDAYVSSCAKIEAYRDVLGVCAELEREDL